jgi:TPR repeat protein
MYQDGKGVPQDDKEAAKWFRLASKGSISLKDWSEDIIYTAKWYRFYAEQSDANAQNDLGWMYNKSNTTAQIGPTSMYEDSKGEPQDDKEIFKWYHLAAEQGDTSAQIVLGVMYRNGEGVPLDNVKAHMWFNIVAANGNNKAIMNRDKLLAKMTSADITMAQRMARECMASNYKNCGN